MKRNASLLKYGENDTKRPRAVPGRARRHRRRTANRELKRRTPGVCESLRDREVEVIARQHNQRGFDVFWRDEAFIWHGPFQVP